MLQKQKTQTDADLSWPERVFLEEIKMTSKCRRRHPEYKCKVEDLPICVPGSNVSACRRQIKAQIKLQHGPQSWGSWRYSRKRINQCQLALCCFFYHALSPRRMRVHTSNSMQLWEFSSKNSRAIELLGRKKETSKQDIFGRTRAKCLGLFGENWIKSVAVKQSLIILVVNW